MMNMFRALDEIADLLARFGDPAPIGARTWNGTAYVAVTTSSFDPYAAKWWSALTALAGILSSQEALSEGQREFLDRFLFGGMGSLNDLALDEDRLGIDRQASKPGIESAANRVVFSLPTPLEFAETRCAGDRGGDREVGLFPARRVRDQRREHGYVGLWDYGHWVLAKPAIALQQARRKEAFLRDA